MLFYTSDINCPNLPSNSQDENFLVSKPSKVLFASDENLDQLIPELNPGELLTFFTRGKWSMHQLIKTLVERAAPAEVTLCTWAMQEEPLRVIHNLKLSGKITRLNGLFEHKIKNRGNSYAFAEQFFDWISLAKVHAKVVVIQGAAHSFTLVGSANLTKNRRIEAGTIYNSAQLANNTKEYIISNASSKLNSAS